jgi:hypothetical protein
MTQGRELQLRFGEVGAQLSALFSEQRRAVLGYLCAAVFIPYLLFFIFPQSNMRGFGAFFLNVGAWYSAETPWTIVSMFMIAIWGITGFIFCAWTAMLTPEREAVSSEVMNGLVTALLFCLVWMVINILFAIAIPLTGLVAESVLATQNPVMAWTIIGLYTLAYIWLLSRLCLSGPVMAAEGSINPFRGLTQSWRLTRGHWWKIAILIGPLHIIAMVTLTVFLAAATAVLMQTDGTTWHDRALSGTWLAMELIGVALLIFLPAALYRAIQPSIDTAVFD